MRTRDALEPLLAAFDMVAVERDGGLALVGIEPCRIVLAPEDLAAPDEGAATKRDRTMEAHAGAVRVRFIDEGADYQTGSVALRSSSDGGALDFDLPAVCDTATAGAMAARVLASSGETDRMTVALAPLEALMLEAGDRIQLQGEAGDWRIESLARDEIVEASLARVVDIAPGEAGLDWRSGEAPASVGAPFLAVLDLPPLPGHETDERPVVVVAADPWRPMAVYAGTGAEALTQRAAVATPARVGMLTAPLSAGVLGRWDEINTVLVRVEGQAPGSASAAAVLGGANAIAVLGGHGAEILQYRNAEMLGPSLWRLTGLLRGQQGTEGEMGDAGPGAVVVFLDPDLPRASFGRSEIGLPLMWRAAPVGAPAGGTGFAQRTMTLTGVHHRPWSPAHVRALRTDSGVSLTWIPRTRTNGDVWEGEPPPLDPSTFRVRVMDGAVERRRMEVDRPQALYAASDLEIDFPTGVGSGARLFVAQANAFMTWGAEASVSIPP